MTYKMDSIAVHICVDSAVAHIIILFTWFAVDYRGLALTMLEVVYSFLYSFPGLYDCSRMHGAAYDSCMF